MILIVFLIFLISLLSPSSSSFLFPQLLSARFLTKLSLPNFISNPFKYFSKPSISPFSRVFLFLNQPPRLNPQIPQRRQQQSPPNLRAGVRTPNYPISLIQLSLYCFLQSTFVSFPALITAFNFSPGQFYNPRGASGCR